MLKKFIITAVLALTLTSVFADESSDATMVSAPETPAVEPAEDSIVSPYFDFSTTSTMSVIDSVESIDIEVDTMELGLDVAVTDKITVTPYFSNTFDFSVNTDSDPSSDTNRVSFGSDELSIGLNLTVTPIDIVSIGFGVSNDYSFELDYYPTIGLSAFLELGINVDEIFLSLLLNDTITPAFTKNIETNKLYTDLTNELTFELYFNFLNFINADLNSGLWLTNTFDFTNWYTDSKYDGKELNNELYVGLGFNPFEFFEASVAAFIINGWIFDDSDAVLNTETTFDVGLELSTTYIYKSTSFSVTYSPTLYSAVDNVVADKISHEFSAAVGVSF
ncbi:MAG: hypothetical protein A2015_09895 [Spirochaetes bacterium GWF1_31_7]|nr:MAG: hypothetical protein A2Y30_07280 [Spirochaetes bacterium GWE1_32_154]OHD45663.1 MAG: hypothetical protein A2Y29_15800 [Spirochaetes bacterium GWE2_31_10]OHD48234.1 MAG: hypothetical protein A2015_09895 [Spirochaetes bacterium GWF1_31_7]HBD95775.1 hypothetical protein [Spirochaetia bacterium]HBI37580.1 hypothetical protein [Spirochaetia bacterium]